MQTLEGFRSWSFRRSSMKSLIMKKNVVNATSRNYSSIDPRSWPSTWIELGGLVFRSLAAGSARKTDRVQVRRVLVYWVELGPTDALVRKVHRLIYDRRFIRTILRSIERERLPRFKRHVMNVVPRLISERSVKYIHSLL